MEPAEDFDEEKAGLLCAQRTRELLGDFAPGLLLLPAGERQRVQALSAYARTLFGFARQSGIEGERLAEINRFEYTLESALSGIPVGQPVVLRLAPAVAATITTTIAAPRISERQVLLYRDDFSRCGL